MGIGFTLKEIITEQFATLPEHLNINQEAQVSHSFKFPLNAQFQ
jgi:hypothetical protein